MTFAELRTEAYARGFDFDSATRLNRWINQAYHEICEEAPWDFLEASTTGTAPLSVSDLRQVISVTDTTNDAPLEWVDRRDIQEADPDLDDAGNPEFFYIDNNTIRVYPLNTTATLSVRYYKVPDDLSSDSDEPLIPSRFQDLIVDGVVYRALKDTDEFASANELRAMWQDGINRMAASQLARNYSGPNYIPVTDSADW